MVIINIDIYITVVAALASTMALMWKLEYPAQVTKEYDKGPHEMAETDFIQRDTSRKLVRSHVCRTSNESKSKQAQESKR